MNNSPLTPSSGELPYAQRDYINSLLKKRAHHLIDEPDLVDALEALIASAVTAAGQRGAINISKISPYMGCAYPRHMKAGATNRIRTFDHGEWTVCDEHLEWGRNEAIAALNSKEGSTMSSETHTACNARLKAEGGKARCCYCVPHDGCEITAVNPPKGEIDHE